MGKVVQKLKSSYWDLNLGTVEYNAVMMSVCETMM